MQLSLHTCTNRYRRVYRKSYFRSCLFAGSDRIHIELHKIVQRAWIRINMFSRIIDIVLIIAKVYGNIRSPWLFKTMCRASLVDINDALAILEFIESEEWNVEICFRNLSFCRVIYTWFLTTTRYVYDKIVMWILRIFI